MHISVSLYFVLVWTCMIHLVHADLPAYTGPYGVGTVDLEIPVANPTNITDTTFKTTGQPAFKVCPLSIY